MSRCDGCRVQEASRSYVALERPMNKAFAYGISALIVGFGLSMLIADLDSTALAALWVITALIPIAIGILSAFGPV